ncbi:MAG: ATP-binding protein, partial [Candidatus Hadarchaeum sp.]
METLPDRLPYNPEWFVDRKEALAQILQVIRQLAAGLPVERRVFFACGERGCGKTWFLHHLAFLLEQQKIASLYVDLVDGWQKGQGSVRLTVERIIDEIQQTSNPPGPFVLLVDNV